MISQKRRSRASQTHILGPKKFLKKGSSQDAFVNPSSILWSKTFRVRFSFFQLTVFLHMYMSTETPKKIYINIYVYKNIYLYMCIISMYVSICIHEHSYYI